LTQAQAEANGNLARARAEAEGNLAKAKADAEAVRLRGEGEAAAMRVQIEAAGAENYLRQIEAQSKRRWKGDVPQFVLGGTGAAPSTPVIVPITATPRAN
jgi:regulator of protease activity HflC (stomatin/prohibitin superfamily)